MPGEQPAKQRDRRSPKVDISLAFCFTPCPRFFTWHLILLGDVIECGTFPLLQEPRVAAALLFTTKYGTCSWPRAENISLGAKVS